MLVGIGFSPMDLRRARTFVTVADLGTVSQAALHLRVAQPALSRQLGELERELGFKLFDRVGRGLVLTGEGEQLLVDCRGLLNYAEAIGERAQLFRRGDRGVLRWRRHRNLSRVHSPNFYISTRSFSQTSR